MNKRTIGWLVLLVIVVSVFAFPETTPDSTQTEESKQPLVSNIFQNTYILDALADISAQTGVTIIPDNTVTGFVSLELDNVPLEKALMMLLLPGGYTFVKIGDFYLVGSPDPDNPSFKYMAKTETVKLKYIDVDSAEKLLPSIYEKYIKTDTKTNMITITAPETIIQRFKKDLAKIDVPAKQVKISVIVTEISKSGLKELGTESFGINFSAGEQLNPNWSTVLGLGLGTLDIDTDIFGQIVAKLKVLEEEKKAKIKADPWIIVNDGKSANLFVGEKQTVVLQPTAENSTVQTIESGITLEVTPRIIDNEKLEITLSPKVTNFSGERFGGLVVSQNNLSTTLYVCNGQTLMISGITTQKDSDSYSGMPILSKIPIIRYLFGKKVEQDEERKLLIFITAEIL